MPSEEATELVPELPYRDPEAALDWLGRAFGFTTRMVVRDDTGRIAYSEALFRDRLLAVVPEQDPGQVSPSRVGGANTGLVRLRCADGLDVDAHCETARAAGARIVREPVTEFFGDRTYTVADLEERWWTFSQRAAAAAPPPPGWRVSLSGSA
jgi:uncharacterized glyoxalase superfamily protein PhnB